MLPKAELVFVLFCPNSGIYEPMRGSVMVWDTL